MAEVVLTAQEKAMYYRTTGSVTPDMPPGTILREATLEDYAGVMEMSRVSGIFNGHDYLSVKYNEYIQDPNRHMFVVEKYENIVSEQYLDHYDVLCLNKK